MQYKLVMFLSKVACHTPYRLLMAVGWVLGNCLLYTSRCV